VASGLFDFGPVDESRRAQGVAGACNSELQRLGLQPVRGYLATSGNSNPRKALASPRGRIWSEWVRKVFPVGGRCTADTPPASDAAGPSWLLSGAAPILLKGPSPLDTLPRCSALS